MAELDVQQKKKSPILWIVLLIVILVILFLLFRGSNDSPVKQSGASDSTETPV
jgi:uncharacterized membrane protein